MRDSRLNVDTVISVATREIIPASTRRVAIIFYPPSASTITLSTDPVTADRVGLTLTSTSQPVELTLEGHGAIVQMAWHAKWVAAGSGFSWIEVFG